MLIVALATLLRMALGSWIGPGAPFILYYPSVVVAGWIGGFGPGLTATLLSALLSWVLLFPPAGSFDLGKPSSVVQLLLFVLAGILISSLTGALHRARRQAEAQALSLAEHQEEIHRTEAERTRLLAATEEALRHAEEASRSKDEFLATISHELRTPLNAMLGWAQLLETGGLDPEIHERGLAAIIRNARHQARLVDDLLDVSRIVSGKMHLRIRRMDPAEAVRAALETIRPAADARRIAITAALDPQAGPVDGDPARLQQVAWNLLANAVKFTPEGGRIEVRLERSGSQVQLRVADTGVGIEPELLPYVFDRFRQLDSSRTRSYGGLGLGLAIVRHLVELHGGTVEAQSPGLGRGTTFLVRLPLARAAVSEPRPPSPPG